MEQKGEIEIRISGKKGALPLTPDNFDIRELRSLLDDVESLLFPHTRKDRPVISYDVQSGSVRHIFRTTLQAVIGFGAWITQVSTQNSIDFLDLPSAKAIEHLQNLATQNQYQISLRTGDAPHPQLLLTPQTHFRRNETFWGDADFYFYGKITNAGGKEKANVHIQTENLGLLHIQTPIPILEEHETNLLYKTIGIRAQGKQNLKTGEVDKSSLVFKDWVDYNPRYDGAYLDQLIEQTTAAWAGMPDKDAWLREIRGGYDG